MNVITMNLIKSYNLISQMYVCTYSSIYDLKCRVFEEFNCQIFFYNVDIFIYGAKGSIDPILPIFSAMHAVTTKIFSPNVNTGPHTG